jgi:hypothetical protein
MFKLLLCVAVAAAVDTEAPVITMDMSEAVGAAFPTKYSMTCEVGKTCTLPKYRGYDTQDKTVTVTETITQTRNDHTVVDSKVSRVNYKARGMYRIRYTASDKAGNKAEPLVFLLKIGDTTKPVIKLGCGNRPNKFDKSQADKDNSSPLCASDKAKDNYDGDVTSLMRYTVTRTVKGKSQVVCRDCTVANARNKVSGKTTGDYTVVISARDQAGRLYSKSSQGNVATVTYYISVVDTAPPAITITGAVPASSQCGFTYKDAGASAFDEVDGKIIPTADSSVDSSSKGTYTVIYTAVDKSGNDASKTRKVNIVDTVKPSITLTGSQEVFHHSESGFKYTDAGAVCQDACNGKFAAKGKFVTTFNDRKIASYTYRLTCTDKSGNTATKDRKVTVVDRYAPIVKLVGKDTINMEASHTGDFEDAGATCYDYIHGNLNNAVRIEGDTVDLEVPGTYRINYECKDPAGHSATPATRFIVVADTKCPTVQIIGANVVSVEAGFPFKDAGAMAKDDFDGDITKKITKSGDTVNVAQAYTMSRSCAEIYSQGARASGNYFILATTTKEQQVFCDMKNKGKTYKKCSRCSRRSDSCSRYGMKKASRPTSIACATLGRKYCVRHSNNYLCEETGSMFEVASKHRKHHRIHHAEQGKYIINYHVKDASGNKECATDKRTVVVRDSLPPVITLHMQSKRIVPVGIRKTRNPATDPKVNPFLSAKLMAESSSVNGWMVAAVASAVAGVALLSFSTQKTTTSVPV